MKEVYKFQSFDGKDFDLEIDCLRYENARLWQIYVDLDNYKTKREREDKEKYR